MARFLLSPFFLFPACFLPMSFLPLIPLRKGDIEIGRLPVYFAYYDPQAFRGLVFLHVVVSAVLALAFWRLGQSWQRNSGPKINA